MANKDVKLIIRARDEASKTLDSVAASLNKVEKAQADTARTARTTDSSFEALGDEVAKFAARLEGLKELGQVGRTLKSLRDGVVGMENGIRNSAAEFARFAREAEQVAVRIGQLRAQSAQLTSEVERQRAATDEARRATLKGAEATKEMARAKRELERLTNKGGDAAAIQAANVAYERATAVVERNRQTHQRLQGELKETEGQLSDVSAKLRESEKHYNTLTNSAQRYADSTTEGKNALATMREGLAQVEGRALEAARGLGAVSAEQKDVEAATEKTTAALRENEAVLKAMQRYSKGGGTGFADPKTAAALRQQREEMERTRQAWQALENDIRRQAVAMRGIEQPTQAQVRGLQQTVQAARAAKAEYNQLQAGLARLQGSLVSSFSAWERGSQNIRRFSNELRQVPKAPPAQAWNGFFNRVGSDSRQALGFMQRLRGEVISLATAYVGLYGAINQIGGVIQAYQKLEAAQNRLGVVFEQNGQNVARELGFLERQADRLGIEFGTLADQYSKFAIAAQSGNFSLQGTRDVFLSVAEAGRVAKLSTEQMGGVFQALEQIISKGKIQSEELRHQLGDRLPGAFSIMAKALGVTTAQLDKMMKDGEVLANESNLIKFAQELDRQFGSQLPQALQSTTTLLGKFVNSIFQAQLQVGRGGFIEGLNKALIELDKWFKSREGRDFFLSLGAALGKFATALAEVPKYFGLIQNAIQLLIALKVAQWLRGIAGDFTRVSTQVGVTTVKFQTLGAVGQAVIGKLTAFRGGFVNLVSSVANLGNSFRGATSGMTLMAARAGAARGALFALNGAMAIAANGARVLWAALGGLPGVLITAATFIGSELIANWVGGVDDATQKIDEHNRILQETLTAYDQLAGKTQDWADAIDSVTLAQAEGNFLNQADLYEQAIADLEKQIRNWDSGGLATALNRLFSNEQVNRIRDMVTSFDGDNIEEFTDRLVELNSEISDPAAKKGIVELLEYAQAVLTAKGRMEEAAAVAKVKGSILEGLNVTLEEATTKLGEVATAAEESGEGMDTGAEGVQTYADALKELKDLIPGVAAEMKQLQAFSQLDAASLSAAAAALREGRGLGEVLDLYGQGLAELNAEAFKPFQDAVKGAEGVVGKSAALLRQFEGYRATPYNDPRTDANGNQIGPNIYRAGYGSNTVTLADGSIREITQGMSVSVADANRDLVRRIGEFQDVIRGQIGTNRFAQFTEDQQAALTSIAYNYGSLPNRIIEAVRSGSNEQIAAAIRSLRNDNGGRNGPRRDAEAFFFTPRGTDVEGELATAERAAAARKAAAEATATTLANTEAELARQRMITLGQERQLAIRTAINDALKENPDASPEELGRIAHLTGQIWDEENVKRVQAAEAEATAQRIEGMEWEISQQELVNQGLERQAAIEQAMREAREENPNISQEELDRIAELTGRTYDLQQAETSRMTALEAAEARVNQLLEHRQSLQEILRMQMEQGDTSGAQQTQMELDGVNARLQEAIDKAIAMWQAIGGPEADAAIAKLRQTQLEVKGVSNQMGAFGLTTQQWGSVMQNFASGLTGVFKKFASAIANGEDAMAALGEAFLEFAANFLIQIGEMIIQQAIFNSLQGFMGGGGGGGGGLLGGLFGGFGHTGGLVGSKMIGSGNARRNLLANLPYFHDGGIVGLKPDETLSVLRKNEEVLTENDPRHMFNSTDPNNKPSGPAPVNLKVVNAFDSAEVVSEGMNSAVGEQTFLNVVKKNASTINSILGN